MHRAYVVAAADVASERRHGDTALVATTIGFEQMWILGVPHPAGDPASRSYDDAAAAATS